MRACTKRWMVLAALALVMCLLAAQTASAAGEYRNPITFRWKGILYYGQAYQVLVSDPRFDNIIVRSSPYIMTDKLGVWTTESWVCNLPDKSQNVTQYRWRVRVVVPSTGQELASSESWTFDFNPLGTLVAP